MMLVIFLMMGSWIAGPLTAQGDLKILTGSDAAKLFVYEGKPLHPFCLGFPLEASSRSGPVELAKCTDTKVVPKSPGEGRLEAEYPRTEGDFFISLPPYVSYGVLAKKGQNFLIASDSSGGGSGQFSSLFWVRLTDKEISVTKDEIGGDRCAGQLSNYVVEGAAIRFDVSTPAAEIVALTGVKVASAISDKLRAGYHACDGAARYRYDLVSEKMELSSLELSVPDPAGPGTIGDPQSCFDQLVRQYARNNKLRLVPEALKDFGRVFASTCVDAR